VFCSQGAPPSHSMHFETAGTCARMGGSGQAHTDLRLAIPSMSIRSGDGKINGVTGCDDKTKIPCAEMRPNKTSCRRRRRHHRADNGLHVYVPITD